MREMNTQEGMAAAPHLAAATEEEAIAIVNRWLHHKVGMALHTTNAAYDEVTFCWHLPIHLAYGATGSLGIIGDVYLHAVTGEFMGAPGVDELQQRAETLAALHGITE